MALTDHGKDTRYFIGTDNNGDEYLVPAEKSEEWYAWVALNEWEAPAYARHIGGPLTFTDPRLE